MLEYECEVVGTAWICEGVDILLPNLLQELEYFLQQLELEYDPQYLDGEVTSEEPDAIPGFEVVKTGIVNRTVSWWGYRIYGPTVLHRETDVILGFFNP